jgi:transcriptional regulator with XRE-family HTH domain
MPPPVTPGAIVGEAVRQLRHQRGWTLETLSEKSHISVSGLSLLETGRTAFVRRSNIAKLASALNVSEAELDPAKWGERVAAEATTLEQRRLVDAVLALPPDVADEAIEVIAALIARKREKKP